MKFSPNRIKIRTLVRFESYYILQTTPLYRQYTLFGNRKFVDGEIATVLNRLLCSLIQSLKVRTTNSGRNVFGTNCVVGEGCCAGDWVLSSKVSMPVFKCAPKRRYG